MRVLILALIALALTGCNEPPTKPSPPIGGGPNEATVSHPCPDLTYYTVGRPGVIIGTVDGHLELPVGACVGLPPLPKPGYEWMESSGLLVWIGPYPR
jgi:hypothetical protein